MARNRARSSSGSWSSSASSSTRWLNRSQDSSRSRNRSSNSPVLEVVGLRLVRRVDVEDVGRDHAQARVQRTVLGVEPTAGWKLSVVMARSLTPAGERWVTVVLALVPDSPTRRRDRPSCALRWACPRASSGAWSRRPVVLDGQRLAAEIQLMLRAAGARPASPRRRGACPSPRPRRAMDRQARHRRWRAADRRAARPRGRRRRRSAGAPGSTSRPSGWRDPAPTLLFIHGGGWIYGDLDSHDAACRSSPSAPASRCSSVDYRLAPEHPFPAAVEDCFAAYRWMVEHAAELNADPARLAVGGDSAGGNISAATAIQAAEARPAAGASSC